MPEVRKIPASEAKEFTRAQVPQVRPAAGKETIVTKELSTVVETSPHLPISIQVLTDEAVYARCWSVAKAMAQSQGLVGKHLAGKPEACLSVLLVSMEWKLNPYMVAKCTYEPVPGGSIGFYGKLVRAIAEQSGRLEKPIQYEWYGDWSKVQGKFDKRQSTKTDRDGGPKYYHAATYTEKDEDGLGVIVRIFMKGEAEPREFRMDLRQAQPRNSTLWALDPKTQLQYTATRRAIDLEAPEILLGMPFDEYGDLPPIGADRARDVTPQEPPKEVDPLMLVAPGAAMEKEIEAEMKEHPPHEHEEQDPAADDSPSSGADSRGTNDGVPPPVAPGDYHVPTKGRKFGEWVDEVQGRLTVAEDPIACWDANLDAFNKMMTLAKGGQVDELRALKDHAEACIHAVRLADLAGA